MIRKFNKFEALMLKHEDTNIEQVTEVKLPSPLQEIHLPLFEDKRIRVYVKRDDLIHPCISGNKWRKLKYNLLNALEQKHDTILTFGGAYSNHIAATAYACYKLGLKCIGVIRALDADENNSTLCAAKNYGMQIHKVSRQEYKLKADEDYITKLREKFGSFYLLPEGGANYYALHGCIEIIKEIETDFDYIITACGTGTTLAGITLGLQPQQKAIGIPVLKQGEFIYDEIKKRFMEFTYHNDMCDDLTQKLELFTGYHFGGYAKTANELFGFMNNFTKTTEIPLDYVYTGKMFFALCDLINKNYFKSGIKIIALHTGGLQGNIITAF